MESFFFNITESSNKIERLFKTKDEYITRVDISNGIVFLDIQLHPQEEFRYNFSNLDRMLCISVVYEGSIALFDKVAQQKYMLSAEHIDLLLSSRQDIEIVVHRQESLKVFVLCIADFILKRYLSASRDSVIDFLYHRVQENISLLHLESHALDALSLYIIEKVRAMASVESMDSLRCEHAILEFLIHRFALIDIHQDSLSDDEICITKSAKEILLKSFVNPPTIEVLAHLCATNETKLKSAFKKRYKTTIYNYIQKLRLQKANLLLREQSSTIGAVAKEVGYKHQGYKHQGHFSKLFFEYYGVYPKDLLKK